MIPRDEEDLSRARGRNRRAAIQKNGVRADYVKAPLLSLLGDNSSQRQTVDVYGRR